MFSLVRRTVPRLAATASRRLPIPLPLSLLPRLSSSSFSSSPLSSSSSPSSSFSPSPSSSSTAAPTIGLPEFSLADKILVVSGGARGLGLVQACALLEAGAREVHAIDRLPTPTPAEDADGFAATAAKFAAASGRLLAYHQADVRDAVALGAVVRAIADRHGRLDGLVAAAGVQQATPALEYSMEDADRMLGVNVTGVFMTAQAVAREMVRLGQGGSIALIASMSGTVANRGLLCPVYNASKAAVLQLGRNLAAEWGQHGIRVNTISPGYIVTAMTEELFKQHPEYRENWTRENMLGRLSRPEEFRGAAVFLLSDASSFMTGSDLRIDGGHSAW